MDINELRNKSAAELDKHITDLRREQFNLRMQQGSGQLAQTHQFRKVRREIARSKTVLALKK